MVSSVKASVCDEVERRDEFIRSRGWKFVASVGGDCSSRRYFRIKQGDDTAVLMESVPDDSPDALPGHKIGDFLRIGEWLRLNDLHAPEIYEAEPDRGFVIMEDLGDISFRKALEKKSNPVPVYMMATDFLIRLRECRVDDIDLPEFSGSRVHVGRRRLVDWYLPFVREEKNSDGLAGEFEKAWQEVEASLEPCEDVFSHIDYHLDNLMWTPMNEGIGCVGIIDFQGAMRGAAAYDVANLLEDARATVPENIRKEMLIRYCHSMNAQDRDNFLRWYRVSATQFHCRVIGQFVKIAVNEGRFEYLKFLPVLASYLKEGLKDPVLKPVKDWFDDQRLDFDEIPALNIEESKNFIRDDAY